MTLVSGWVFIGDELTGAGFRLAGLEVYHPDPSGAGALVERLIGECEFILLTAEVADGLPDGLLKRVQLAGRPMVLVVSDVRRRTSVPDLGGAVRRQLGMTE